MSMHKRGLCLKRMASGAIREAYSRGAMRAHSAKPR
jgi:hypothetical protein